MTLRSEHDMWARHMPRPMGQAWGAFLDRLLDIDAGGTITGNLRMNGDIQMENLHRIYWRNAADDAWVSGMYLNGSDQYLIGAVGGGYPLFLYGNTAGTYLNLGNNARMTGMSFIIDNSKYYYGRNAANTGSVICLGVNSSDQVRVGVAANRLTMYSNGNVYLFGAGFRLDNGYYLYGLNNAGTAARPLAGVDASDNCVVGSDNLTSMLLNGPYIRYSTSAWEDLRVSVNSVRVPTSANPGWGAFLTNLSILWFDKNNDEEVYFSVQMPHQWKEGTDIKPHVHWTPGTSTDTGSCRWALVYSWANIDGTFPATTEIAVNDPGSGTANDHQLAGLPDISGTGKTISSMLICKLYRDANSVADTFDADAGLLEIDFHFEIDAPGSDAATSKT